MPDHNPTKTKNPNPNTNPELIPSGWVSRCAAEGRRADALEGAQPKTQTKHQTLTQRAEPYLNCAPSPGAARPPGWGRGAGGGRARWMPPALSPPTYTKAPRPEPRAHMVG